MTVISRASSTPLIWSGLAPDWTYRWTLSGPPTPSLRLRCSFERNWLTVSPVCHRVPGLQGCAVIPIYNPRLEASHQVTDRFAFFLGLAS